MYVNKATSSRRQVRHLSLVSQVATQAQPAPSGNLELLAVHIQSEVRTGRAPRVSAGALQALWACGMGRIAAKAVAA
ncbi:hypothetical protein M2284_002627 [Rhodococcus sp. LBL1]|nr:hypothetical protein [Rhodococcus sp. LBL1]MDH6684011.1 hypothetical protein [Rhodococcus sp. LBL2]